VGGQFSLDGDSPNSDISLPRTLKIKIFANPAYWPALSGSVSDNVLVSGYAYFSNGHYDFFYGFEEDHIGCRTCGIFQDEVCTKNEQRPDLLYRSVIDENGVVKHYKAASDGQSLETENITRGGAEVFLIDRPPTKFHDSSSCNSTDPEDQFKKNPDNFGFGNKILFSDKIYKNVTGAWRLSECSNCYGEAGYIDSKLVVCNTGDNAPYPSSKQQIHVDSNFGTFYDPAKRYCTDYDSLDDCIQDGAVPTNYSGQLISLNRSEATSWFLEAAVSHTGGYADSLRNGQYVALDSSGVTYDGGYHIFDVEHAAGSTTFSLLGTYEETAVSYTGPASDSWQVYNTIDPSTCCGGAAYGIDNTTKGVAEEPPYHVDIRRVFNNSKNKLYSNREKFSTGEPRTDRRYIETATGIPLLTGGETTNVGELPYYGRYYDLDTKNNTPGADTYLRYSREKQTTYQNGTCYTKSQELMIFPDSLVQSYEYESCREGTQHRQNIVPRLTFVYKPCNYNDSCSFNASGHPMTAGASGMPSTLEDLKRGFGGQEIVMHVNLGTAWGNKTRDEEPCACPPAEYVPPGEVPFDPEVKVPSPISYVCFPKFDLRPSGYGCQDPMYYNAIRDKLGISYQGHCVEPPYDACQIRQPYTTYGYIRNLCGSKQNSRIDVLKSLKDKQPDGGYTDVSGSGDIVEPMYVNFLRPLDDTGIGFPTDGSDPFLDVLPPSTGGDDEDGDGIPDNSGVRVNRPYWGLTDDQGRLAFPYFHTKLAKGVQPCPPPEGPELYDYIAYDTRTTITDGWPTDEVPFLIEIDHEDYCVGCATNQIDDKQYSITIESLPASYFHGTRDINNEGLLEGYQDIDSHHLYGFKYGFNYCKYPGRYAIPKWRINDSGAEEWLTRTSCVGNGYEVATEIDPDALPYTGETCGCLGSGGITIPLRRHQLLGTDMPKYYSTDGGTNSYVAFPSGCSEPRKSPTFETSYSKIMKDYTVYFAAFIHCGYIESVVPAIEEGTNNTRTYGNLATLLNCGGCSHSYPATNSKPNLSLDFWYVRKGWETWFEHCTDMDLTNQNIVNLLADGAGFNFRGPWQTREPELYEQNILGGKYAGDFSQGACGSGNVDVYGLCVPSHTGLPCSLKQSAKWEAAASYSTPTCTGYFRDGTTRTIRLATNVPGCDGSVIRLYGYSHYNDPTLSTLTDGGFNENSPHTGTAAASGCCEHGAYYGVDPNTINIPLIQYMRDDAELDLYTTCVSCGDAKHGCKGRCGALHHALDCYGKSDETCYRISPMLFTSDGQPINHPLITNRCWMTSGNISEDLIGTFNWAPSGVGNCPPEGYYGSIEASHAELFFRRGGSQVGFNGNIRSWDGENIPGIGTVAGAPVHEPVAIRIRGGNSVSMPNAGVSTCNYDSGPNNTTLVASEFATVARTNKRAGYTHQYMHMGPVECTKTLAGSEVGATCVRPIYPNTMASISAGGTGITRVAVNKATFHPEIMTVHKIECVNGVYALHVSREYYEHDRKAYAYKVKAEGEPPLPSIFKYPIYGKLEGGRDGIAYHSPPILDGSVKPTYFFEVCDTSDTGVIFSNPNNETTESAGHPDGKWDYPIIIPMMSRADYISPCYDDSGCVRADEPFNKSLCVSYYDINSYEGGSGTGASGYLQSNSSGVLSFVISNSGAGYVYEDSSGNLVSCARAIFDNPCAGLTLGVDTGIYSSYGVTGYAINLGTCGAVTAYPDCCDQYKDDPMRYDDCINDHTCGSTLFPPDTTWPVSIIGCDAVPKIRCDGITIQTCPNGDPKYPNFYNAGSGTSLWNYYNLVYDQANPDARFLSDAGLVGAVFFPPTDDGPPRPFPTNEVIVTADNVYTGFVNGSLIGNRGPLGTDATDFTCSYSCIRDNANCGGEFFTNKEFLPRRKYATGTKVTRYGPLSICAQTAERSWGNWLHGHVDLSSSIIDTKEMGGLDDVRYVPLVDPSKAGAYTMLTEPVGLADDIIYVAELTTLLGAKHPFFKMLEPQSLDNKSCIMPDSGCFNFLPIHNASTANGISETRFFSGEDVYYTDGDIIRTAISNGLVGTSGCLLNPFKIMVDVEPCGERLGHVGTSDPMNLSWVVQGVPAGACRGWLYPRSLGCDGGTCDDRINNLGLDNVFHTRVVPFYKCTDLVDTFGHVDDSSCSWDAMPDPCPCMTDDDPPQPSHTKLITNHFVFTGGDQQDYIILTAAGGRYGAQWDPDVSNSVDVTPKDISYDCANIMLSSPSCPTDGSYTSSRCGIPDPPDTIPYYNNRTKYPFDPYGNNFCDYFLNGVTNFNAWKASTVNCTGNTGVITGYRNYKLLDEDAQCVAIRKTYEDYGCKHPQQILECPFPSVLKITITEAS
jgi:hypothetical protein